MTIKTGPKAPSEPIKGLGSIARVRGVINSSARDTALFDLGINTGFRAGDILAMTMGDGRKMRLGKDIQIRQQKTDTYRRVPANQRVVESVARLVAERPDASDDEPLFVSQGRGNGGQALTVASFGRMVKDWCAKAGLEGSFSAHTLRKTMGYTMRAIHEVPLDVIQSMYGHSSGRITLTYVCIQPDELNKAYMTGM